MIVTFNFSFFNLESLLWMNPECFLGNLPDEYFANSQKNVFNHLDFEHILNNDNGDPDTNFFSNLFDVVE